METLSNWDKAKISRLETLYRDGLSFSLIGAEIGVTRNAAIGKAHRLKLPKRVEIVQCKRRTSSGIPTPRPRRVRIAAMKKAKPVLVDGHDYRCGLLELTDCTCRYPTWPVTAPIHERFYCGVPTASLIAGIPYCERHSSVCGSPRQH